MRLGYACPARPARSAGKSFNEAEAHAPRIQSVRLPSAHPARIGFNEAEAHAPRIPRTGQEDEK